MGIDRLTKAASAAGFAMVNSEDFFGAAPVIKVEPEPAWKHMSPVTALVVAPRAEAPQSTFREWWHLIGGGRVTA